MSRKIVLLAVILAACEHKAVSADHTNNPNVPVEMLFEHDGCQVFRFEDGGRSHYYVRCGRDQTTAIQTHAEYCGKNCVVGVDDPITLTMKP